MRRSLLPSCLATLLVTTAAHADPPGFLILANRGKDEVKCTLTPPKGQPRSLAIPAGELMPIPVDGPLSLAFTSGKATKTYDLAPFGVYFLADFEGGVDLQEISPGGPSSTSSGLKPCSDKPTTVTLKLLVDEEEPGARKAWEDRLRKRVAEASAVFERQCRVKLEVVAVDTWKSDDEADTIPKLLLDFMGKVDPAPARLAIGFSSQKLSAKGEVHLGATTVPLAKHAIVREWKPKSEPERLEVLVHEIAHFLGAAHSPEPVSVMRPNLGDGRAMARRFSVGLDPLNAFVTNLVADGMRDGKATGLGGLSLATRGRLMPVYLELARAMPEDTTPLRFIRLLEPDQAEREKPRTGQSAAVRAVLEAIVRAAGKNDDLPRKGREDAQPPFRRTGDELTAYLIQAAAEAASRQPADHASSAFVIALGIGLDRSDTMRKNPVTAWMWRTIESDDDRKHRLEVLGVPTLHEREDLAEHFVVSAALTALLGTRAAESAGLLKEWMDSDGGSGFSFADLAADVGGVALANHVLGDRDRLAPLARAFAIADHILPPKGLIEGLDRKDFEEKYGSLTDERFVKELTELRDKTLALPGYKVKDKKSGS